MVTIPRRGSLICISIVAETIWRMRTASLRARAGSAIADLLRVGTSVRTSVGGPLAGARRERASGGGRGGPLSILVAEELAVRREQRHLRAFGQQPLAGVEDVGHLLGVPRDGGDTDLRTAVQVLVADLGSGHREATPQL